MSYPGDTSGVMDLRAFREALSQPPAAETVAAFQSSPEIQRLPIQFDVIKLREALAEVERRKGFSDDVWGATGSVEEP